MIKYLFLLDIKNITKDVTKKPIIMECFMVRFQMSKPQMMMCAENTVICKFDE